MRTTFGCVCASVAHWTLSGAAWAQAGVPQNELDSDTVVGFITIAVAAIIYWIWKKRRPDAHSNLSRQQAFTMPTPAPTAPPAQTPVRERTREPGEAGSVFISYRRGDAGDVVGRIYDRLVNEFGKPRVFKDVDSIPLGVDFRKHLSDSVGKCRVFLAIISRGWVQQGDGVRRLDQPNDFVRIEMEAALHRNIPVIPVLVQGASLPQEEELPASLRELAYRNATAVRADPDFHADITRLIDGIAFHLNAQPKDVANQTRPH
jgi:hypothetical protein